ncbi:MAG: hypothetical protein M0R03_21400 [Novosphingobium sp.]|jgi:abortive infection bacteriophage resistance protein|nr:hypothetical protein [Novosphingobium sp.]
MTVKRTINILGFDVDVVNFGYASYLYPQFNGNVEYKLNKEGFKELYSYLRRVKWIRELAERVPVLQHGAKIFLGW